MLFRRACLLLLGFISVLASIAAAQTSPTQQELTLTGIVIASDHRCAHSPGTDPLCRLSDWALASGSKTYLLFGDATTLHRFERQRANVTGILEQEFVNDYGTHMVRRRITVKSIEPDELPKSEIERLVQQLKAVPWQGPKNFLSPTHWMFSFTDPMIKILQAGRPAQEVLLAHIGDKDIRDQIVILLGGVGDEKVIGSIIDAMEDAHQATWNLKAKQSNLVANLALTNVTVSEVIWHHGGGITVDRCPQDPKTCWANWWKKNKDSFKAGIGEDRLYTNYPNYGIYAQFDDSSVE